MKLLLMMILGVLALPALADVYKSVNANGSVTYSDTPLNQNAEKIDMPQDEGQKSDNSDDSSQSAMTTDPSSNTSSTEEKAVVGKEKKAYTRFSLVSPQNGETIQNQPAISVEIAVDPQLQEGDMIQIYLDGAPWGAPEANTHFQFNRPDRGTHTLSAKLIDSHHTTLKEAGPNTIYIHQASLGNQGKAPAVNSQPVITHVSP